MGAQIKKIFHANIYTGNLSHLGKASEVKLPELSFAQSEHKALGMFSAVELSTGLEKLTMSIKWTGLYPELIGMRSNPFAVHDLQVRASLEEYTSQGRSGQVPVVGTVRVAWTKGALGTLKPMEAADGYDDELSVKYIKLEIGGQEHLEIDPFALIWKVDGTDLLAELRANLGL
jgi:hypothetical protein